MVIVRTFGDAIVSQELNKEAWKMMSREFKWNEELLQKYQDEINWKALSSNAEMLWTVSILENFKNNIDWKELSKYAPETLLIPKIIAQFEDKWDWNELSGNSNLLLSYSLLDQFADKWNWARIINCWRSEELFTPDFWERYKEYIPVGHFQDSYLWNKLVEKRFEELTRVMIG